MNWSLLDGGSVLGIMETIGQELLASTTRKGLEMKAGTYKCNKLNPNKIVYSVHETADLLGMSLNGVYLAIEKGQIPVARIGAKILISKAWLMAFLAGEVTAQKIAA
jgi:excisionase family DNA binding protein